MSMEAINCRFLLFGWGGIVIRRPEYDKGDKNCCFFTVPFSEPEGLNSRSRLALTSWTGLRNWWSRAHHPFETVVPTRMDSTAITRCGKAHPHCASVRTTWICLSLLPSVLGEHRLLDSLSNQRDALAIQAAAFDTERQGHGQWLDVRASRGSGDQIVARVELLDECCRH